MLNFTFLVQFVLSAAVFWLKKMCSWEKSLLIGMFLVDIKNFLYKIEIKWEIVGKSGE